MNKSIPSLQSQRLRIVPINEQDAEFIHFMRSDPIINEHIDRKRSKSIADALHFIKARQLDNRDGKGFFWSIYPKSEDYIIGSICLWNLDKINLVAELGYDLHPDAQKKGFMREAVASVIQFGFLEAHLKRIVAFTSIYNLPSQKVLSKAGFVKTDEILSKEDIQKELVGYTLYSEYS